MTRSTIRYKAQLALAALVVLALLNMALGHLLLAKIDAVSTAVVTTSDLYRLTRRIIATHQHPRAGDPRVREYLFAPVDAEVAAARISDQPTSGLTEDDTQLDVLWGDMARDWQRLHAAYDAMRSVRAGGDETAVVRLETMARELEASIGAVHFLAAKELDRLHDRMRFAAVTIGLLDLVVVALLLFGLHRRVLQPLSRLALAARDFSADDYRQQFAAAEANEIGDLARALDRSAARVNSLVASVRSNAQQRAQAEEKFRVLVEHAGVGVFLLRGGRFTYVNRRFAGIVGRAACDVVDLAFEDTVDPRDRERIGAQLNECLEGATPKLRFECRILLPDGSARECEVFGSRTEFDERPAVIGTLVDHTERAAAQSDLRKLQRAIEQSPATVVITDRDGVIEYINPRFCELTGYDMEEAVGRKPSIVSSGLMSREFYREFWTSILAGRQWAGEILNRKKNGELFWEHMIASAVRDAEGTISHFVAVKEDITERKRAERELASLNRTLRVLSEANQNLVHAEDEPSLLHKTCRSLIDQGGYRYASVSRPDGQGNRWRLLAEHGDRGAAQAYVLRSEDAAQAAELAVKEARTVIERDPTAVGAAVDAAAGQDTTVRSSIALPLRSGETVLGVLEIHSEAAEGFAGDEQGLLRELADDLAYGMWSLATRDRRELAEQALRESEQRFRSISASAHDAIVMIEADGRISYWNAAAERITGFTQQQVLGRDCLERLITAEGLSPVTSALAEMAAAGQGGFVGKTVEFDVRRSDGSLVTVEASTSATQLDGRWQLVLMGRDISARKAAQEELKIRNRAIESSNNAIIISRVSKADDNPIIYVNPAFERITGYRQTEVEGRNPRFLLGEDWEQAGIERLRDALRRGHSGQVLLRNYRKEGQVFWAEISVSPVLDDQGNRTHYISVITDVTERIDFEDELRHSATHDGLTGLANRVLLTDRIDQAVAHANRSGRQAAVLMLDLDRFKFINDSLGHGAGDAVVKAVGRRLESCVRHGDTVARIGGDEFAVVLAELPADLGVTKVIGKIELALAAPVDLPGQQLYVTASVGVSLAPADGSSAEALLRNADAAMYAAKEHGGNCFRYYQQGMNDRAMKLLSLEADLRGALEREEFVLHYQPKLDLITGSIAGVEALIRWRHPQRGMISPLDFIPLAEETGLIVPIGEWALDRACADAAEWRRRSGLPVGVAVNISARQFRHGQLPQSVESALRHSALPAEALELELTESMIMHHAGSTIGALEKLKSIGIKLSIDDFGTGYSSLSYLRHFPVDVLKIDRSFVKDLADNEECKTIAGTIMVLAHGLGMRVVAEGVESIEQLSFLQRGECDMIQGHLFSKPLPANEIERLLADVLDGEVPPLARLLHAASAAEAAPRLAERG